MATPEEKLAELGLTVPEVVPPVAAYQPAARSGNLVFTAGQLPSRDGAMLATGKLGDAVTEEQGYECARQCALNALAAIKSEIGDLSKIKRVVKAVVFVASTPDFTAPAEGRQRRLGAVGRGVRRRRQARAVGRRRGLAAARRTRRGRAGRRGLMR